MLYFNSIFTEYLESLHSIVDMFRIALETVGNKHVEYCIGPALQKRVRNVSLLSVPTVSNCL